MSTDGLSAQPVLVFIAAVIAFGVWRGWHRVIWRHRVGLGIVSVPVLAITIWLGWSLGSPLFTNVTVEEEFPFAYAAVVPVEMEMADVEGVMAGMAMIDDPVMDEAMPAPAAIDAGATVSAGGPGGGYGRGRAGGLGGRPQYGPGGERIRNGRRKAPKWWKRAPR